jgi:hypothetical protein
MGSVNSVLLFAASIGALLAGALLLGSLRREAIEDFKAGAGAAGPGVISADAQLRIAK